MTDAARPAIYPKRPPFYAQNYTRLLAKLCVANEVGADGCFFLATVAALEDGERYTRGINFYNTQLMPIIGQTREQTFRALRAKLMAAGWLHCEIPPSGSRQAAVYWTTTPEQFSGVKAGTLDESEQESAEYLRGFRDGVESEKGKNTERSSRTKLCDIHLNSKQFRTSKCYLRVIKVSGEALFKRPTSYPSPLPSPLPDPKKPPTPLGKGECESDEVLILENKPQSKKRSKKTPASADVEAIYQAYPRKDERPNAIKAISVALTKIPFAELLAAVQEYAAATKTWPSEDLQFIPYPAKWFNQEKWYGDRSAWIRKSTCGRKGLSVGPGQSHVSGVAPVNRGM